MDVLAFFICPSLSERGNNTKIVLAPESLCLLLLVYYTMSVSKLYVYTSKAKPEYFGSVADIANSMQKTPNYVFSMQIIPRARSTQPA
jgi:hypothetical protein